MQAGSSAGGGGTGTSGYASGLAAGIMREASFKANVRTLRKRAAASASSDAGFTTFTSGISAGWQREIASRKFRQVRIASALVCCRSARPPYRALHDQRSFVLATDLCGLSARFSSTTTPSSRFLSTTNDYLHAHSRTQAVAVEFIATAIFVAVGSAVVIFGESPNTADPAANPMPYERRLMISLAFGFLICALVFSTGSISGGNLNPAVTASLALTRKMSLLRATCYILAQCAGAVAGSAFIFSLAPALFHDAGGAANAVNYRNDYYTTWTAVGGEMLGTALLVWTVSSAADVGREKANKYQGALTPLNIGLAVMLAHFFLLPIDGCSINPARSFGSAAVMNQWDHFWVFVLGPMVGGPLTALLYENFFKAKSGVEDPDTVDDVGGSGASTVSTVATSVAGYAGGRASGANGGYGRAGDISRVDSRRSLVPSLQLQQARAAYSDDRDLEMYGDEQQQRGQGVGDSNGIDGSPLQRGSVGGGADGLSPDQLQLQQLQAARQRHHQHQMSSLQLEQQYGGGAADSLRAQAIANSWNGGLNNHGGRGGGGSQTGPTVYAQRAMSGNGGGYDRSMQVAIASRGAFSNFNNNSNGGNLSARTYDNSSVTGGSEPTGSTPVYGVTAPAVTAYARAARMSAHPIMGMAGSGGARDPLPSVVPPLVQGGGGGDKLKGGLAPSSGPSLRATPPVAPPSSSSASDGPPLPDPRDEGLAVQRLRFPVAPPTVPSPARQQQQQQRQERRGQSADRPSLANPAGRSDEDNDDGDTYADNPAFRDEEDDGRSTQWR